MKSFLLILPLILLFSSCDKLEMLPVEDSNNQSVHNNRFFEFNANEKFGDVPPSTITVDNSVKQASRSYIEKTVKTAFIRISDIRSGHKGIKLLEWIGFIVCIIFSIIGLNNLDPKTLKENKIRGPLKVILLQAPIVLFFIFIDYPFLFLMLWFVMIIFIPATISAFAGLFNMSLLSMFLLFIFELCVWGYTGYKAGSRVYIDNATSNSKVVIIHDKKVCELPPQHFTKIRISGQKQIIEVTSGETSVEKVILPVYNGPKSLLKHAFFPWKKYIYNINGSNTYYLSHVSYF